MSKLIFEFLWFRSIGDMGDRGAEPNLLSFLFFRMIDTAWWNPMMEIKEASHDKDFGKYFWKIGLP